MTLFRLRVGRGFPWVQLEICGHRVHHGLIGLALAVHDGRDWRRWIPDLLGH
jgi:hypothetical protein